MKRENPLITAALWALIGIIPVILMNSCDENAEDYDQRLQQIRINKISGDNQIERTGANLPAPLVVQTTNVLGTVHSGVRLFFSTDEPGAEVTPSSAVTGQDGTASFRFRLGTEPGTQSASVVCEEDSAAFSATAREVQCEEESTTKADHWPSGHIMITTTSSSLLSGSGSVLIDYDPATQNIEKVLETTEWLIDLALSPRGELYVATRSEIFKVNPETESLSSYCVFSVELEAEIVPNPGGVLVCGSPGSLFLVSCPQQQLSPLYYSSSLAENLAVSPLDRTVYYITGSSPNYWIRGAEWDGARQIQENSYEDYIGDTGSSAPRGMCVDSTGTVYLTIDGTGTERSIRKFDSHLRSQYEIIDFYEKFGNADDAGRWGDIAALGDTLYIIDKRNDRLAFISTSGDYLGDLQSDAFSLPGSVIENERYGITAIP